MPAFIKNQPWVGKIGCIFLGAPVDLMSISFAEEIPDEHLQVLTEINNESINQLDIILFVLGKADQAIMDRVFTELKLLRAQDTLPVATYGIALESHEKVALINAGLNECLSPNESPREMLAKMRALIRRYGFEKAPASEIMQLGDCVIDFTKHTISLNGETSNLSPIEYRLLKYFEKNKGVLLTQQQIFSHVWGVDKPFNSHYVVLYIGKIRKRIGDVASNPQWIVSDKGLGYRFMDNSI